MPWKVKAQNEAGAEIADHFEAIHKYNHQLQNAISIASYAVSLEQLENVLNASNMLKSIDLRSAEFRFSFSCWEVYFALIFLAR